MSYFDELLNKSEYDARVLEEQNRVNLEKATRIIERLRGARGGTRWLDFSFEFSAEMRLELEGKGYRIQERKVLAEGESYRDPPFYVQGTRIWLTLEEV